nr:hypothetical protein [Ardenticatenales bacterium]
MSARSNLIWPALIVLTLFSILTNLYLFRQTAQLQAQIATIAATAEEARTDVAQQRKDTENVQRQIDALSNAAGLALANVEAQLGALETQVFTMTVPINEQIPIHISFPFAETFAVPINTTVPINLT